jgi:hypothetical protein
MLFFVLLKKRPKEALFSKTKKGLLMKAFNGKLD